MPSYPWLKVRGKGTRCAAGVGCPGPRPLGPWHTYTIPQRTQQDLRRMSRIDERTRRALRDLRLSTHRLPGRPLLGHTNVKCASLGIALGPHPPGGTKTGPNRNQHRTIPTPKAGEGAATWKYVLYLIGKLNSLMPRNLTEQRKCAHATGT